MPRLQPLREMYNRQQLPKVDWLDKQVFRDIELICDREKQSGDFLHLLIETQKMIYSKSDVEYTLQYIENGSDQKVVKNTHHEIRKIVDFTESENLVEDAQLRMARSIGNYA